MRAAITTAIQEIEQAAVGVRVVRVESESANVTTDFISPRPIWRTVMLRARLSIAVLTLIAIVSHGSSQGPGIGQQMSAKGQAMRAQGRALGQQQKAAQGQAMGQKMAAQGQQHFSKVT